MEDKGRAERAPRAGTLFLEELGMEVTVRRIAPLWRAGPVFSRIASMPPDKLTEAELLPPSHRTEHRGLTELSNLLRSHSESGGKPDPGSKS